MQKSPYKFLDSYSKEDRDIFFGRDKEIEELHSRVFESRILVVYGTSGTGKSSLINCGLANKFNDSDWLPITVRRGVNINRSLFDNLNKAGLTTISKSKSEKAGERKKDILRIIQSTYLDHFKPIYIIFDQFEELFIFGSNEEREELITDIGKVIESDLQCRFIFCVREEYLAGFTEFEKVIPSFLTNRIRIEKMTRQNAISVIEGPCRLNEIAVEPGFPEMLLEKLNPDNPDVELTYLQVYLDKVFRMASDGAGDVHGITKDLLDRAGEVKDLLGTFLEEQISQLDDPDSGMVILKSFVSVKGTKHQITEEDVIEYSKTLGKDIDREKVRSLLQKFIRLRILRDKDENNRYELRHDSLATKIYEEITLVEKELLEIRQFLENAFSSYEKRDLFLTAEDLNYIAPYEERLFLNEKMQDFIDGSKRSIHRAKRRRQNILIITAVTLITILSFFSIWAFRERSFAMEQKNIADEQKNEALRAKLMADSARVLAMKSESIAVEKEKLALEAQKQSEVARREAMAQRAIALQQKNIAETLSVAANKQAWIAGVEKNRAEQERSKAVAAEAEARRLGLLSNGQNIALKSSTFTDVPQLMGLLAVQAYNFNRSNGGMPNDQIIWEALINAWSNLDSSKHSIYAGSPNEIRTMAWYKNELITADLDGVVRTWSSEGKNRIMGAISNNSPVSMIRFNPSGEWIVTQHDNLGLFLWKTQSIGSGKQESTELTGHKGLIRSVAFSADEEYLATAGTDSLITVWNIQTNPASKIKTFKAPSSVNSLIFCGKDSIVSAQEENNLIMWSLDNGKSELLSPPRSKKIISLAYNYGSNIIYGGSIDGIVVSYQKGSQNTYPMHNAGIDQIIFNSDLSLMATSGWERTVRIYYLLTKDGDIPLTNLTGRVRAMLFTGDGQLVAALSDKTIRLWEMSSDKLALLICNRIGRDLTRPEWDSYVGSNIPYEKTCNRNR